MTISADAAVTPQELTVENIRGLSALEPFGADNERPLFYIGGAQVLEIIPLSNGVHTKLRLKLGYSTFDALMFRTPPQSVIVGKGDSCDLIVTLGINEFRGNTSISVVVRDMRPSAFEQSRYFAAMSAFESFIRSEQLPANYYPSMLPERNDVVQIYKGIPDGGICTDTLYLRLGDPRINYCKFNAAIEALRQLGLVSYSSADSTVSRVKVSQKAELNSAPILVSLREHIK